MARSVLVGLGAWNGLGGTAIPGEDTDRGEAKGGDASDL